MRCRANIAPCAASFFMTLQKWICVRGCGDDNQRKEWTARVSEFTTARRVFVFMCCEAVGLTSS